MKAVFVTRGESTDEGTFGVIALDGMESWLSLELPWRDNLPRVSCIPPGVYTAVLEHSPHFGMQVYHVLGVEGRDAVEIHPANFAGDVSKGYRSDLLGCLTLGMTVGEISVDGHGQKAILQSRQAFGEFMEACAGEDLTITIT